MRVKFLARCCVVVYLSGCQGSLPATGLCLGVGENEPKTQHTKSLVTTKSLVPLAIVGASLSVGAVFYGIGRIAVAGLVSSLTCLMMSLATLRYAWLFALLGLAAGVLVFIESWLRTRRTQEGFIKGFQEVKHTLGLADGYDQESGEKLPGNKFAANQAMGRWLTPEGERYVRKWKTKHR